MSSKFTRRRFLTVLGTGSACLAVTGAAGLGLLGRATKVKPLHTPKAGPLRSPKVWPLPDASPATPEAPWAFRSRLDLSPPAVAAERTSVEEVEVYASWNGGTEVENWTVLAGERPDQLEPLGAVPRDGFETAMVARTPDRYVAVQARDRFDRTRGTSKPVETGNPIRSS